jgi:hypothetical protein
MFGYGGQGREQCEWLKMNEFAVAAQRLDIAIAAHSYTVSEKNHVKFSAFSGLCYLPIMRKVLASVCLRARVTPGCNMMPGILQECA